MGESESSWVFDSLVCFLNGPVWNAPIQSFIEEKSLIFEANTAESPNYVKIYEEYKNLVDVMLGSYMEDIGISPGQFEEACLKGHLELAPKHFDNSLFEQIWAANDYEMFKRMMTHRNVELQLQALELIEQKYGVMPESFIPHKSHYRHITGQTEAEIVLKDQEKGDLEEEIMEEVIKQFPFEEVPEEDPQKKDEEVQYLLEEKQILQETLRNIEETAKSHDMAKVAEDAPENTPVENPSKEEIAFYKRPIASEIDQVELKKRQEYFRAQRDKLVALKKEARKKHLEVADTSQEKSRSRPKSARVAKAVLTGDSPISNEQLKIRKALAERLKQEVIGSTDL
ncbi:hypothetical protein PPYR_02925 [Photinus pyralis]|uniref:Cilia- and flagella-associated protein 36 n=2 Tax=Photinus pyralis TaxID=7054 RepID=A0A5N4A1C7_PHOPY|nr:cilia- and flagella-associated protein 36 isoform X2 [Photinus pyralis]XP_031331716.1 cilia- and flagella-associated protein 36 isoform X2 [Photinus pyralis]XP_031331717.1 cilia- and flagella-associated protein 36 isoform X2 [Photinus pyralis]KAB0791125.1 hypothetical protein PPYR_02925 [Photinus pyralis]